MRESRKSQFDFNISRVSFMYFELMFPYVFLENDAFGVAVTALVLTIIGLVAFCLHLLLLEEVRVNQKTGSHPTGVQDDPHDGH